MIVTGASGRIGTEVLAELSDAHELRVLDRRRGSGREGRVADLARRRTWTRPSLRSGFGPARWTDSFRGVDAVVHLAADPRPHAPWTRVLRDNIQVTWNVLEAAVAHGVRRLVFASSHWAVKALEQESAAVPYETPRLPIGSAASPRPLTLYGVSKAFGEVAGRMLVDEGRLSSFVAVRIGSYHPEPPQDEDLRRRWIGSRDLRSLFRRCVEADFQGFHVVYGVSAQPTAFDLSHTRALLAWEPRQLP